MSRVKKTFLIIIIFIVIILISITIYLSIGTVVGTQSVFIDKITKDNKTLQINGMTSNSALAFSGYSCKVKGNILYLKVRHSIGSFIHNTGEFNITLNNDLKNVNYIYLQGNKTEDKKLVWTKYSQGTQQNSLPIQMSTENINYKSSIQKIKFRIINNGNTLVTFGYYYSLEKNKNGKWVDIPFKKDTAFIAALSLLNPKKSREDSIALSMSDFTFKAGSYRMSKVVSTKDKKNIIISCNFNIN